MRKKAEVKKAVEKAPKREKKLSFKFNPRLEVVMIKGAEDDADVPEEVLEAYGFTRDEDADNAWGDITHVAGDIQELSRWGVVKVLISRPGRKRELVFEVSLGGCDLQKSTEMVDAMEKARRKWNMSGRPIDGVTLLDALERGQGKKRGKRSKSA